MQKSPHTNLLASMFAATGFNLSDEAAKTPDFPGYVATTEEGASAGATDLITSLLTAIMSVAALLLLLFLVWGAVEWLSAGGDKSKIEKARDKMSGAVIGIIILAAAVAIYHFVIQFVGLM